VLYTDSTHLKASANKGRFDVEQVAKSRADYWDALDAAVTVDRAAHDKKPLSSAPREPVIKENKVSRTAYYTTLPITGGINNHGETAAFGSDLSSLRI
jgi:hypothetical protein